MFDLIYYQRYDFTTVPAVRFWNARERVVTGKRSSLTGSLETIVYSVERFECEIVRGQVEVFC